jgi:hypothetical protein
MWIPTSVVEEAEDPSSDALPPVAGYIAWYDPSYLASVTYSGTGIVTALADRTGSFSSTGTTGTVVINKVPGLFSRRPVLGFYNGLHHIATNVSMSDISSSYFVVANCFQTTGFPTLIGPSADAGLEIRIGSTTGDRKIAVLSADTIQIGDNDANLVTAGDPFVAGVLLSASDVTIYNNLDGENEAHAVTFTAGRTLTIGRAPTVNLNVDNMAGWIGEILVYDTTLSSGDATLVITYLMDKWGIT